MNRRWVGGAGLARQPVFQEILVGEFDSALQINARFPAERKNSRAVHEFARGAVRLGQVPHDLSRESDETADGFGQIAHGDIAAVTHIDNLSVAVIFHQADTGFCQIIDVKKFPHWCAGTPAGRT